MWIAVINLGNYMYVENDPREEYGHYKEYYNITQSSVYRGITSIGIDPGVERSLDINTGISAYDKSHPSNWFGGNLDLNIGENEFLVKVIDDVNNFARTPTHKIYYDPFSPVIESVSPSDGTITGNNQTQVEIKITEVGVGLQKDTIKLRVNEG